jgi:hypothetical protein
MTLYYYIVDKDTIVTHDGHVQLGLFHMSEEYFLSKVEVEYLKVYWIPDIFYKRYKRVNYQHHIKKASIDTKNDEHLCSE